MRRYIPVLTIAGSDSSGGAGIQADIKTMSAIGCYGMSAITALTAQNTVGVEAIEGVSPMMVKAQIDAVFADISPAAVKTGMLFSSDSRGCGRSARTSWRQQSCGRPCDGVDKRQTPDRRRCSRSHEADTFSSAHTHHPQPQRVRCAYLLQRSALSRPRNCAKQGCANVLVKGGDSDAVDFKTDMLLTADGDWIELKADAVDTPTHTAPDALCRRP